MKTENKSPKEKSSMKSVESSKGVQNSDDAIRERAYHIYLNSGSIEEHDNWIQAEKEHNSSM